MGALGQANYIHSLASATSSKYMRAGGKFTKRDHEFLNMKINILVIFNVDFPGQLKHILPRPEQVSFLSEASELATPPP